MTCRIALVEIDVPDPDRAAEFWAELLGWSRSGVEGGLVAVRAPGTDGSPWDLVFRPEAAPKRRKNRLHLDLASESPEHQPRSWRTRNGWALVLPTSARVT